MRGACENQAGVIAVMAPLGSRSAAVFDLDGDGDLDIVTNDFNSKPQVLVSDLAQRRQIHWLGVRLIGTASNRDGLGATVRVQTAQGRYTKYKDGKSGYLSQSSLPLYFGLGDATAIQRVEVLWPSGRNQAITENLGMNQTLTVTEPR
jgi:enediyne biosynthesis protein E4